MKIYQYNELGIDDVVEKDEVDILDEYWDYWCNRMKEKYPTFRKDEMDFRNKSECIEDWIVCIWAWEKK